MLQQYLCLFCPFCLSVLFQPHSHFPFKALLPSFTCTHLSTRCRRTFPINLAHLTPTCSCSPVSCSPISLSVHIPAPFPQSVVRLLMFLLLLSSLCTQPEPESLSVPACLYLLPTPFLFTSGLHRFRLPTHASKYLHFFNKSLRCSCLHFALSCCLVLTCLT